MRVCGRSGRIGSFVTLDGPAGFLASRNHAVSGGLPLRVQSRVPEPWGSPLSVCITADIIKKDDASVAALLNDPPTVEPAINAFIPPVHDARDRRSIIVRDHSAIWDPVTPDRTKPGT